MIHGFLKACTVSPALRVADCAFNTQQTIAAMQRAAADGAQLAVFPELGLTGYTCGDLFFQQPLQRAAAKGLAAVLEASAGLDLVALVGLPVAVDGKLYNCAAVVCHGKLLGLVPKTHLPNYGEFYEKRQFNPAPAGVRTLRFAGQEVPFGTQLLFRCAEMPEFCLAAEVCHLPLREVPLTRPVSPTPFVPADDAARAERCELILAMQADGLAKRIAHAHAKTAVIGISGGLDSSLALLVAVHAMQRLGRPAQDVLAVTMPCFGTTHRTRSNAEILCEELGVTFQEIPIARTVHSHFADIGQDEAALDVTYENCQARVRTLELMDLANRTGGLVVGTGDLSELALGWATYNGDHMSMYGVNADVPKTLVRHIVRYAADAAENEALRAVLLDILDTPVSPELLPANENGEIAQQTESLVGPYELHDFYLYYVLRFGFGPAKIYRLARHALGDRYPDDVLLHWLKNFYRRFFAQQFKRSCLPDGPKIGSVTLSPRGDWRMPSDACAAVWQAELDQLG